MKKMKDINKKFHNMVQPLKVEKPDGTDYEFIPPSGQFWQSLSSNEKDTLRQLLKEEGQDMEDFLHEMRKMLPFSPRGKC